MIEIKDIYKSFGSVQVLKGVSTTIDKGEIVSIVGASGAGKTTLLQIVGTLDKPDSGQILYDDVDVTALSEKEVSLFRNRKYRICFSVSSTFAGVLGIGECYDSCSYRKRKAI